MGKHDEAVICSHIVNKAECQVVVHLGSDHRRIGKGDGNIIIPYRKEIPPDGGYPGRIGEVQEFIGP